MNLKQVRTLVKNTPNDAELGAKIRSLYLQENNINEVNQDPKQTNLNDMINEIEKNGK